MALMRVRLELARNSEFPEGGSARGYEFTITEHDGVERTFRVVSVTPVEE